MFLILLNVKLFEVEGERGVNFCYLLDFFMVSEECCIFNFC